MAIGSCAEPGPVVAAPFASGRACSDAAARFPEAAYEAINAGIQRELEASEREQSWLPSPVEQVHGLSVSADFFEPRLTLFRSLLLQGGALAWPDCQAPGKSWYVSGVARHMWRAWREIRSLRKLFRSIVAEKQGTWIEFEEDGIGAPYASRRHLIAGPPETMANLRHSFYHSLLSRVVNLGRLASVLEIGGGFGALTGRIGLSHPRLRLFRPSCRA